MTADRPSVAGDGAPRPRRQTGFGNALRFIDMHGADVRYCHAWKQFLLWDGKRFAPDDTAEVLRLARETVAGIYAEAAEEPDADQRKALVAWALRSENEGALREMASLVASESGVPVRPAQLDTNAWYFNVSNGTIDLRTGKLLPHSRNDLITKLANVAYDVTATCPTWEKFLRRVLGGDAALIAFVQKAIGYSLTGMTTEQVVFLLYGTGKNGKSVFVRVLRKLLGEYGHQAEFSTFLQRKGEAIRNDIARLQGARFVAALEADEGARLAESLVKQLTGGDAVTARFLHAEFFEFEPQFKLWLAANHKPTIAGTDHAIWRRIRLIPFTVVISEQERDPVLAEKLTAELPGILHWAVQGCLQWQRDGLGMPPAVVAATESYRAEMDVLADFLADTCRPGPRLTVEAGALYAAYTAWCEAKGERAMSQRALGLRLKERAYEQVRGTGGVRSWSGLGLVTRVADSDADFRDFLAAPPREEKDQNQCHQASPASLILRNQQSTTKSVGHLKAAT